MPISRQTLIDALLERIRARVPGLVTIRRKGTPAADLDPVADQPALCVSGFQQTPRAGVAGRPTAWALTVHLDLFAYSDSEEGPLDQLLALLDQIEAALEADPEEQGPTAFGWNQERTTTLGGLVATCRLSGQLETLAGALGPQGLASIPVELTVYD